MKASKKQLCKTGLVRSRPKGAATRLRETVRMFNTNFTAVFLARRPEMHRPGDPVFSR